MAIALASTAHGNTTTQNLTINKPTGGWVAGSVLIACVCGEDASSVGMSTPAGWTRLDGDSTNTFSQSFYHVCGASEPASYTWSTNDATNHAFAACVLEYSGVDNAAPINVHSIHTGNSADKTIVWDSTTTTTVNGCKIVAIGAVEVTQLTPTLATPTGFTAEVSDNSGSRAADNFMGAVFCFDKNQTTAGAIGSTNALITTTSTAANTYWAGYFVALTPGSTGPQTYNVSQAESASASDSSFSSRATSAALPESASASDSQGSSRATSAALPESASASDSQTGGLATDGTLTEAVTATEGSMAFVDLVSGVSESVALADAVAAILGANASVDESVLASDSQIGELQVLAILNEVGTVSDVVGALLEHSADIVEAIVAADVAVGQSNGYTPALRPNSVTTLTLPVRNGEVRLRAVVVVQLAGRVGVVHITDAGILTVPARVVTVVKP